MFHGLKDNIRKQIDASAVLTLWAALVLGFSFLLRGAEIINLRWCDASIISDNEEDYLIACIRRSKADVDGQGGFRSLFANGIVTCPWQTWCACCDQMSAPVDSKEFVFPPGILSRIRAVAKWIARSLGMCDKLLAVHSLRDGGGHPRCLRTVYRSMR